MKGPVLHSTGMRLTGRGNQGQVPMTMIFQRVRCMFQLKIGQQVVSTLDLMLRQRWFLRIHVVTRLEYPSGVVKSVSEDAEPWTIRLLGWPWLWMGQRGYRADDMLGERKWHFCRFVRLGNGRESVRGHALGRRVMLDMLRPCDGVRKHFLGIGARCNRT